MAWYLVPYRTKTRGDRVFRYCAMDDYTRLIEQDGGVWDESEVAGNHALVRVKAGERTLAEIAADAAFIPLPDNFGELSDKEADAIREKLAALYSSTEVDTQLGDLKAATLTDVLTFTTQRRVTPRFDKERGEFVFDQEVIACKPVSEIDKVISKSERQ